ncbi:fyve-domain-containing protein [Malassezia pachydermatis]|uniref:Fyve-domain-containing protein n=1 Tax=Malassezia pachydermatis TaxID=77020 RepID=A0A0M8MVG5_9BASI|nr:fyve-domain-containing protein [Malassezia pachydermatis]KOS14580.1 fyve-domain-containing protein [Malassezia pachydermatis]
MASLRRSASVSPLRDETVSSPSTSEAAVPNEPGTRPSSVQVRVTPGPLAEYVMRRSRPLHVSNPNKWEPDEDAKECRQCGRSFTLFYRRHHCRLCGKIYCDACTSNRVQLTEGEMVIDPMMPDMREEESQYPTRVCDGCYDSLGLLPRERAAPAASTTPTGPRLSRLYSMLRLSSSATSPTEDWSDEDEDTIPSTTSPSLSASIMERCPVCDAHLSTFASTEAFEQHVAHCLEQGVVPARPQRIHFVTSTVPSMSPLVGKECIICMEEFDVGDRIARLTCFCCFHVACIKQWLEKASACPIHSDEPDA